MSFSSVRIAIFASGNGSNAQAIINYFSGHPKISVSLIVSNKADAFVLSRAKEAGIPSLLFTYQDFKSGNKVLDTLNEFNIDFIVLAGFLLKVPHIIIDKYPQKILNIHPALLPKFGGKGMFGSHVHEAVLAEKEKESGITIHFVNNEYDKGDILFQARCPVMPDDTPETLASRIHTLEHKHFPAIIEKVITGQMS